MQSQNREVVTATAVAIAPNFLKSPLGSKIFPHLHFFFFYISSSGEWQLICFWSFQICVHVFLFVTYTKCSTNLFVISCPAVASEADTTRVVHVTCKHCSRNHSCTLGIPIPPQCLVGNLRITKPKPDMIASEKSERKLFHMLRTHL
jgi:hypothetical protein